MALDTQPSSKTYDGSRQSARPLSRACAYLQGRGRDRPPLRPWPWRARAPRRAATPGAGRRRPRALQTTITQSGLCTCRTARFTARPRRCNSSRNIERLRRVHCPPRGRQATLHHQPLSDKQHTNRADVPHDGSTARSTHGLVVKAVKAHLCSRQPPPRRAGR